MDKGVSVSGSRNLTEWPRKHVAGVATLERASQTTRFEVNLNNIQNYGSKLLVINKNDTIFAERVISFNSENLTVDLLNSKWANLKINQYFNEEYSQGSSVPYEISIDQIDCIVELNRPNFLKEYAYIGIAALVFWGILTIFQLI